LRAGTYMLMFSFYCLPINFGLRSSFMDYDGPFTFDSRSSDISMGRVDGLWWFGGGGGGSSKNGIRSQPLLGYVCFLFFIGVPPSPVSARLAQR
jgi:hypothetical protein